MSISIVSQFVWFSKNVRLKGPRIADETPLIVTSRNVRVTRHVRVIALATITVVSSSWIPRCTFTFDAFRLELNYFYCFYQL